MVTTRYPGLAPWAINMPPLTGLQSFALCILTIYDGRIPFRRFSNTH